MGQNPRKGGPARPAEHRPPLPLTHSVSSGSLHFLLRAARRLVSYNYNDYRATPRGLPVRLGGAPHTPFSTFDVLLLSCALRVGLYRISSSVDSSVDGSALLLWSARVWKALLWTARPQSPPPTEPQGPQSSSPAEPQPPPAQSPTSSPQPEAAPAALSAEPQQAAAQLPAATAAIPERNGLE